MTTSSHALELIRASENAVIGAAEAWWKANGYTLRSNGDASHFSAARGSRMGFSDERTQRIMEVILRPVTEGTAVSVYHHTGRVLFIVGIMFSDILQAETDNFMRHLREYATRS